jgi:hypothetical protein
MHDARDLLPDDLARQSPFQILTRIGFLGRGLLYISLAALVMTSRHSADLSAALEVLGDGVGRWLLILIAIGLTTYGVWRLTDAAFGTEAGRHSWKSRRKRLASAGVGIVYLYFAYKAAHILLGGHAEQNEMSRHADTILDLPGGSLMLAAIAIGVAIAALVQARIALRCTFLDPLDADAIATPVTWLGRIGYSARAVILLLVAFLIARSAIDNRSAEAGGTKQALALLSMPWLYAVATGLLLFGIFGLIEARYRRVRRPPVDKIKRDIDEAMRA